MKKEKMVFPLLIFSPNPQFLYFFPHQPFPPLMDHEMSRQYTIINRSVPYINKKITPLFLFLCSSFSFPLFPFPFFLLFHFLWSFLQAQKYLLIIRSTILIKMNYEKNDAELLSDLKLYLKSLGSYHGLTIEQ